ncbi:MAG: hypothetical protein JWQ71_4990, partial [Pedosphaera sp.]|nr:hypothetical protein [Pedosphaera sp.]
FFKRFVEFAKTRTVQLSFLVEMVNAVDFLLELLLFALL